jgi:hypothetical protein
MTLDNVCSELTSTLTYKVTKGVTLIPSIEEEKTLQWTKGKEHTMTLHRKQKREQEVTT